MKTLEPLRSLDRWIALAVMSYSVLREQSPIPLHHELHSIDFMLRPHSYSYTFKTAYAVIVTLHLPTKASRGIQAVRPSGHWSRRTTTFYGPLFSRQFGEPAPAASKPAFHRDGSYIQAHPSAARAEQAGFEPAYACTSSL